MKTYGNFVAVFWFGFLSAALFCIFVTEPNAVKRIQDDAISAHVAKWDIDPVTGEKKFIWITGK